RERRTKARFEHEFPRTLRALGGGHFFESMQIESLGWVDGKWVRRMYQEMTGFFERGDARYRRHAWPLWMICGTELWFRTQFGGDFAPPRIANASFVDTENEEEAEWKSAERTAMSHSTERN